jgi:DNA-binding GntR family transcriptional regulator
MMTMGPQNGAYRTRKWPSRLRSGRRPGCAACRQVPTFRASQPRGSQVAAALADLIEAGDADAVIAALASHLAATRAALAGI